VLLASLIGVDNDDVSLVVNPRLTDVRRPVRHQRAEMSVAPSLNQLLYRLRKRFQFALNNELRFVKISSGIAPWFEFLPF
jgi:hypothetical protein